MGHVDQGDGNNVLFNSGTIIGDLFEGTGADRVSNINGSITGDVHLGFGADSFDGRGGMVGGTVFGGDEDDIFIGNATWADVFDGGSERDTLDFRTQGAVSVALDNNFDPGGAALGDEYTGFENIFGSRGGNDLLRGDGAANTLYGLGGADQIDGAGGHDFLRGATGIDALTGGLGNDAFAYGALNEIGDTISDFSSVAAGNNDVFRITASAFGGGLVAGTLAANQFQTRADNVAQDGDDRFIFRTTDKTLWFDADGNGLTSAAVMVADLQASATMTNLDILVV